MKKHTVWKAEANTGAAAFDWLLSIESRHLSASRDAGPQGANGNKQQRGKALNLPSLILASLC